MESIRQCHSISTFVGCTSVFLLFLLHHRGKHSSLLPYAGPSHLHLVPGISSDTLSMGQLGWAKLCCGNKQLPQNQCFKTTKVVCDVVHYRSAETFAVTFAPFQGCELMDTPPLRTPPVTLNMGRGQRMWRMSSQLIRPPRVTSTHVSTPDFKVGGISYHLPEGGEPATSMNSTHPKY